MISTLIKAIRDVWGLYIFFTPYRFFKALCLRKQWRKWSEDFVPYDPTPPGDMAHSAEYEAKLDAIADKVFAQQMHLDTGAPAYNAPIDELRKIAMASEVSSTVYQDVARAVLFETAYSSNIGINDAISFIDVLRHIQMRRYPGEHNPTLGLVMALYTLFNYSKKDSITYTAKLTEWWLYYLTQTVKRGKIHKDFDSISSLLLGCEMLFHLTGEFKYHRIYKRFRFYSAPALKRGAFTSEVADAFSATKQRKIVASHLGRLICFVLNGDDIGLKTLEHRISIYKDWNLLMRCVNIWLMSYRRIVPLQDTEYFSAILWKYRITEAVVHSSIASRDKTAFADLYRDPNYNILGSNPWYAIPQKEEIEYLKPDVTPYPSGKKDFDVACLWKIAKRGI